MGNKVLFLNLLVTALTFGMQWLDAAWTTKGIAKGGFEGNPLITLFFKTPKPTFRQLLCFTFGFYLLAFVPLEVCSLIWHQPALAGFATACGIGFSITHFLGFRAWVKWLKS